MLNVNFKLVKAGLLKKMGPSAWAVLTAIVVHMDGENKAYPGKARLRELTGLGRDSVTNAIKTLKELGLLLAEQQVINGKKSTNIYRVKCDYLSIYVNVSKFELSEEIEPHTENQYTGNTPHTENQYTEPHTDLPCTGNQYTRSITNTLEVLPISSLTKAHTQKKEMENFETQNHEAIPVNDLKTEKEEKEKSCAKKEKEDYGNLPPKEQAIMAALDRGLEFFQEWPDMETKLKEEARIKDPEFEIKTELLSWLRLNAANEDILSRPEKYIHSLFAKFLLGYNHYHNKFSKGKNYAKPTNKKSDRPLHLITPDAATRIMAKFAAESSE